MTSAPSPTSPLASASLHEDNTLLRIALDRPKANILTMAMMQTVAEVLNAVERLYVEHILTRRDGIERISAYLERRKPVWENR